MMLTNSGKPNGGGGEPTIDFPDLRKIPIPPFGRLLWLLLAGIAVFLAVSSYYQIAPYETGVILRFGKFKGLANPGPNFRIPIIDAVYRVPTERQLKEEFGFRTLRAGQRTVYDQGDHSEESLMLTGDLNIAEVQWVVQYRIREPREYLFSVRDVQETIRAVAEAEMRGVVGDMGFNEVIKTGRQEIEVAVQERMATLGWRSSWCSSRMSIHRIR
jgi:membrane protease subunit HflK